jgi:uncharacterized protein (DUF58 family)
MNGKVVTVGLIVFGLLLVALITRNGNLALMAAPFLAYLGAGILETPSTEKIRLTAERSLNVHWIGESASVEVEVTVHNSGTATLYLRLYDPPQPAMKISEGRFFQRSELLPGEETQLNYTFQVQRGKFSWQTLQTVVSDPLGLFETQLNIPAEGNLQIQPQPKKFRRIALRPYSTLHSPGSIPARMGGSGTDFWGVREYHPGDSLRWLDWRLAARHPNQFYTKEFEQEEIADIILVLDARKQTDLCMGQDSLFEYSLNATASLAEVFIHQGHRLGMLIFGERILNVSPGYGKIQLNRILRNLARVEVGSSNSTISLNFLPLRTISSRALVIILSPLAPTDFPVFPRLRAHGNQGLLICPDPIDFVGQHEYKLAQDSASSLAVRLARVQRHLELRKIAQLNIAVIDWRVSRPLSPLVHAALTKTRGQREH